MRYLSSEQDNNVHISAIPRVYQLTYYQYSPFLLYNPCRNYHIIVEHHFLVWLHGTH